MIEPVLKDDSFLADVQAARCDDGHFRLWWIEPARLDFIDIVTASHAHTDHLDPETLRPLARANRGLSLAVPEASRNLARERTGLADTSILGLSDGESATLGEFRFSAIASAHEHLENDSAVRALCLGYVVQFGPWTMYHSGDTVLYDGMVEKLRRFASDVAADPAEFTSPAREAGQPSRVLRCGQRWDSRSQLA